MHAGARRVIVTDIKRDRLDLAKRHGADVAIDGSTSDLRDEVMKLTEGNGVPRLVEASGVGQMVNTCFTLLRKVMERIFCMIFLLNPFFPQGASLVLIGLPKTPIHIEDPLPNVVFKSLTMKTVHGRRIFHTWEQCEKLIAEKKVTVMDDD